MPSGRFELFGSSPANPASFSTTGSCRWSGGAPPIEGPVRWTFAFRRDAAAGPGGAVPDGSVAATLGDGVMIGRTEIRDADAYLAWESTGWACWPGL